MQSLTKNDQTNTATTIKHLSCIAKTLLVTFPLQRYASRLVASGKYIFFAMFSENCPFAKVKLEIRRHISQYFQNSQVGLCELTYGLKIPFTQNEQPFIALQFTQVYPIPSDHFLTG